MKKGWGELWVGNKLGYITGMNRVATRMCATGRGRGKAGKSLVSSQLV